MNRFLGRLSVLALLFFVFFAAGPRALPQNGAAPPSHPKVKLTSNSNNVQGYNEATRTEFTWWTGFRGPVDVLETLDTIGAIKCSGQPQVLERQITVEMIGIAFYYDVRPNSKHRIGATARILISPVPGTPPTLSYEEQQGSYGSDNGRVGIRGESVVSPAPPASTGTITFKTLGSWEGDVFEGHPGFHYGPFSFDIQWRNAGMQQGWQAALSFAAVNPPSS